MPNGNLLHEGPTFLELMPEVAKDSKALGLPTGFTLNDSHEIHFTGTVHQKDNSIITISGQNIIEWPLGDIKRACKSCGTSFWTNPEHRT